MSAASLAGADRVVADAMRFKARLRIGDDAYALRRLTKEGWRWWDAVGAAGTAAAGAKSTVVASALFAPSVPGFVAWLGLAPAAVTPIGWVVAAAALAGGGYYGVSRWWTTRPDTAVDVIPRFINTPLDQLGVAMFDLVAGLSLFVARADGVIDATERAVIVEHLQAEWGFDPSFVAAALPLVEADGADAAVEAAARQSAAFLRANPDCNSAAIQRELLSFLRDVTGADGRIDPAEQAAIARIEAVFADEAGWSVAKLAAKSRALVETAGEVAGRGATRAGAMVCEGGVRVTGVARGVLGRVLRRPG